MTRIIMHGCNGHMGQVISDIIAQDPDCVMAAGIDIHPDAAVNPYPVFTSLKECTEEADVVIDFSSASAITEITFAGLSAF